MRLEALKEQLQRNNFAVTIVQSAQEAAQYLMEDLLPKLNPTSVSHGGSMTLGSTGLLDKLGEMDSIEFLSPNVAGISPEQKVELRRQALLVDLYLTGANAVTEDGCLVNLDMFGNRVAALTFGPKKVVVFVGRNKIVPDLESAMYRIKDYAAPTNAMRLNSKTPCVKTSECADCESPGRICNTWTISEKSYPKERVTVVLINEELGL